ncbi:thioesterase domain-containing protein [Streptomyces sp. NPDC006289]|uniref:thioesterase domain-containing protein n=1 Tax=Streptomyces sp. NPDC006289 TaxID=3156744 RepID=UPI0033B8ABAA
MRRSPAVHSNPRNRIPFTCQAVERLLCEIGGARLGRAVSPYDDFFELGGDSLSIIGIATAARERGLPVRSSEVLRFPVPARLAEHLTLPRGTAPRVRPHALDADAAPPAVDGVRVLPVADGREDGLLCVVHSQSHVLAERNAVASWAQGRAAVGLSLPGAGGPVSTDGTGVTDGEPTVAEAAERCLAALLAHRPTGPYRLAGFGHGAVVAFETAHRLRRLGADVALLALIAPPAGPAPGETAAGLDELLTGRLATLAGRFALTGDEDIEDIHARFHDAGWYEDVDRPQDLPGLQRAWARIDRAVREYDYPPYDGTAVLVADGPTPHPAERAWSEAPERLTVHRLDLGLASSLPVIGDPRVGDLMRKVLEA